jgi:hypothetical protein
MNGTELRSLLTEFMEVISDMTAEVQALQTRTSHLIDSRIEQEMERDRVRTGAPRPPKTRTLAEKVSSLRERVKSLPT